MLFLKNSSPALLLLFLILSACSSPPAPDSTPNDPPNLILIIADDLAWDDLGCYGHPNIRTPNIDRLAAEGMRFTHAFLTTSSCSPSRSSIITGTYPHQTDAEQLHWPLPGDRLTFVEKLKEAGYWTGQAGKWHLGEAVKDRFDQVMEGNTAGFIFQPGENTADRQEEADGSGCQNWMNILNARAKDRPFFLWLAAIDPHRPYEAGIIEQPHSPEDAVVPPYLPDEPEVRADLAAYYDEVSRLDGYVGQLLEELDRQGLRENTLILFITDNGRPFPRDKTTLYDGGIKTPWIVRWPARVQAGGTSASLISSVDIAPTFLTLAGIEPGENFEGADFGPALTDPGAPVRDYIYAEDHWHDFEDYTRAVRDQRYKYIRNFYTDLPNTPPADALRSPTFEKMRAMEAEGQLSAAQQTIFQTPRPAEELYDLETDPYELQNLAGDPDFAAILARMKGEMERIRTETGDELPPRRTPDEFTRDTGLPLPNRLRPRPSKAEMFER